MSEPTRFSLFKRSNGFWYVLHEKDGRRCWKSTRSRSKQEALKTIARLQEFLKPKPKSVLLSEFVKEFLQYVEPTYSAKTARMYKDSLHSFQKLVGDIALRDLTCKHIDTYKAARLADVSPVSVNIELRTLRAAFNTALRWDELERNPFSGKILVKVQEQAPVYFSKEDFQSLLSLIKENWLKELVVFAVVTGMRRGEIVNLLWEDVDLARKVIHVRGNANFRTKHGKNRVVPLSDVGYHLLASKAKKGSAGFVFTLNGRKIKEDWPSQKLKKYIHNSDVEGSEASFSFTQAHICELAGTGWCFALRSAETAWTFKSGSHSNLQPPGTGAAS